MNSKKLVAPIRGRRRGVAFVELAVVMATLVSIAFGTVEFAYCFYVKHVLAEAATQGAWIGSQPYATNSQVTSAVAAEITAGLPSGFAYTVATTPTDVSTASSGSTVTVKVSCVWGTAGAGFRPMQLIPANKTVASSALIRKQQ